ncbi:MAG: toll/interleukin-1 receptor domain-containing protein [Oscillospiraceae bacterium]|nr:toll/interleukin-1 receptor domain-containing protein [Oscillospiraceae bacterium]MBR7084287.1 toll/interleukin-1 receptor domain-containing protein [Oscillospiraceae bacterium]
MHKTRYDIFISYRRDGGFELAKLIYEMLTGKGYHVFMDVEVLREGKFNQKLYKIIKNCNDIIVILSPHSLDRCMNDDDWVRKEIVFAMKQHKKIIPVQEKNFVMPDILPDDMQEFPNYNRLIPTETLFNEAIDKLCREFLTSKAVFEDVEEERDNHKNQQEIERLEEDIQNLDLFMFGICLLVVILRNVENKIIFNPENPLSKIIQDYAQWRQEHPKSIWVFLICIFISFFIARTDAESQLHSMKEWREKKYKGKIFNLNALSLSPQVLFHEIMQIPDSDRLHFSSKHDMERKKERLKAFYPAIQLKETKNLLIASFDGTQIDYLYWEPNEAFSFLGIDKDLIPKHIMHLLIEQGFAMKDTYKNSVIYEKDDFEVRVRRFMMEDVEVEICRGNIQFSMLHPFTLSNLSLSPEEIAGILKIYDVCLEPSESDSIFQESYKSTGIEISSCDGKQTDYIFLISYPFNEEWNLYGICFPFNCENRIQSMKKYGFRYLYKKEHILYFENEEEGLSVEMFCLPFVCYTEFFRKRPEADSFPKRIQKIGHSVRHPFAEEFEDST